MQRVQEIPREFIQVHRGAENNLKSLLITIPFGQFDVYVNFGSTVAFEGEINCQDDKN
jgi:hypothetical protein